MHDGCAGLLYESVLGVLWVWTSDGLARLRMSQRPVSRRLSVWMPGGPMTMRTCGWFSETRLILVGCESRPDVTDVSN
jgi:hypothetical protein